VSDLRALSPYELECKALILTLAIAWDKSEDAKLSRRRMNYPWKYTAPRPPARELKGFEHSEFFERIRVEQDMAELDEDLRLPWVGAVFADVPSEALVRVQTVRSLRLLLRELQNHRNERANP